MPFLTARVYEHSHPLAYYYCVLFASYFSSVVSLELLRSTRLRYFLYFLSYSYFILITCTIAFPPIGNKLVISLELLHSTWLSISSYRPSITDKS